MIGEPVKGDAQHHPPRPRGPAEGPLPRPASLPPHRRFAKGCRTAPAPPRRPPPRTCASPRFGRSKSRSLQERPAPLWRWAERPSASSRRGRAAPSPNPSSTVPPRRTGGKSPSLAPAVSRAAIRPGSRSPSALLSSRPSAPARRAAAAAPQAADFPCLFPTPSPNHEEGACHKGLSVGKRNNPFG